MPNTLAPGGHLPEKDTPNSEQPNGQPRKARPEHRAKTSRQRDDGTGQGEKNNEKKKIKQGFQRGPGSGTCLPGARLRVARAFSLWRVDEMRWAKGKLASVEGRSKDQEERNPKPQPPPIASRTRGRKEEAHPGTPCSGVHGVGPCGIPSTGRPIRHPSRPWTKQLGKGR